MIDGPLTEQNCPVTFNHSVAYYIKFISESLHKLKEPPEVDDPEILEIVTWRQGAVEKIKDWSQRNK